MAATLKLYVDWFNKRLVKSNLSSQPFTLPSLYQGDVLPFQIQIVEPDPEGGINDFVLPDIDNMSLKLVVAGTPTGTPGSPTPFVTQFTWTKDLTLKTFTANVAFNTSGLDSYLGSAASATAYLEIEMTEGSAVFTIYQGQVTLKAELIEAATLVVTPGETPLSLETAVAMFAQFVNPAGQTITFKSPDGAYTRTLGVANDQSPTDIIAPV